MNVADSFVPTAGSVGLLPIVTYFFLVVATLVFLGIFIVAKSTGQPTDRVAGPLPLILTLLAVAAASTGLIYYLIQSSYRDLLTELPAVSDATDRQTLIRESYNAVGQYRYVAWFISAPILLMLLLSPLRLPWESSKRLLVSLFGTSLLMVFTGFIGHQQLSFDNEILTGPKAGWGGVSLLSYGYLSFALYRLWKNADRPAGPFRSMAILFIGSWGIYLFGYACSLLPIDFNWLHLSYTFTDIGSQLGIGLLACTTWSKPVV